MPGSIRGACSTCTDFGPPEKMIPAGRRAASSSAVIECGTISLYTWASRTRRAMSCAYCAPKSTTRTVSYCSLVIGSPWGDGSGVHHEVRLLELLQRLEAGVGHRAPEGTEQVQLAAIIR